MHPDQHNIDKYLRGELNPTEMHRLERKALSDPFLQDALAGADTLAPEDFLQDVDTLNRNIRGNSARQSFFTPLRIAAGIALLAAVGFWFVSRHQPVEQIAQLNESAKQQKDGAAPADTVNNTQGEELLALSQQETKPAPPAETKPTAGPPASTSILRDDAAQTAATEGHAQLEAEEQVVAEELLAEETIAATEEKEELTRAEKRVAMDPDKAGQTVSKAKSVLQEDLKSAEPAPSFSLPRTIRGQVKDMQGQTLPGVNVTIKGTTIGTVTDASGNYKLTTSIEQPALVFSFIGLQTAEVPATDRESVDVMLEEDAAQLSEVVVTGHGYQSRDPLNPVIRLAEPLGGRKAYNNYLEKSKRFPQAALDNKVKGRVTIEFTVETDGTLAGFHVLQSLGYGCDEEVTRLVKEGPRWFPSTEDDKPIESQVRVRLKFDHTKAGG